MHKRLSYGLMYATAWLSAANLMTGCKEDPPPPPVVPALSGAAAGSAPAATAITTHDRGKVPRVDATTTKRSRIEACYWGSLGISVTRDAYLKSMAKGEPSATLLPDFGEFPEHIKRAEAMKKAGREPKRATNMPYLRHLRACKHSKGATGVKMSIDTALAEWEAYATKLHTTLVKVTRYYARKAYEKDDFKEGIMHDKVLKEMLPQYDEKLAAFTAAMHAWHESSADWKPKEKLDEGGKVALEALTIAATVGKLLTGETRDEEAINKLVASLTGLDGELKTLREEKKRPPHPKVFGPKLTEFVAAAEAAVAIKSEGKLTPNQLYPVTAGLALLYELNQRSMEQLLRQRNGARRKPMRMLDPRNPNRGGGPRDQSQRARGLRAPVKK